MGDTSINRALFIIMGGGGGAATSYRLHNKRSTHHVDRLGGEWCWGQVTCLAVSHSAGTYQGQDGLHAGPHGVVHSTVCDDGTVSLCKKKQKHNKSTPI